MAKKEKNYLCRYDVTMCDTEVSFFCIDQGTSEEEVEENNEVEHDDCGLDTEDSPVGGCIGEKCTVLVNVKYITPNQKDFLNSCGIH